MTDSEWIIARKKGIGASECAAVCGKDPFKTALQVYLDKLGELPPVDESDAMFFGTAFEPAIAQRVTQKYGIELVRPERRIMRHSEREWMLASFDFRRASGDRRPVQIKTTNEYKAREWGAEGTDEIPDHIHYQVHHEMAVADVDLCDVAVLIGGQRLKWYPDIRKSNALLAGIMDTEATFWAKLQKRIPPDPQARDLKMLKMLGRYDGPRVPVSLDQLVHHWTGAQLLDKARDLHETRERRLELSHKEKELETELRFAMNELGASIIELPDDWQVELAKWLQHRKAQEEKVSECRGLRVYEPNLEKLLKVRAS